MLQGRLRIEHTALASASSAIARCEELAERFNHRFVKLCLCIFRNDYERPYSPLTG